MLTVLERRCLDLSEAVEQLSEKQELLATLVESKKSLQKDAPENFTRRSSRSWWSRSHMRLWSCWDASTSWEN